MNTRTKALLSLMVAGILILSTAGAGAALSLTINAPDTIVAGQTAYGNITLSNVGVDSEIGNYELEILCSNPEMEIVILDDYWKLGGSSKKTNTQVASSTLSAYISWTGQPLCNFSILVPETHTASFYTLSLREDRSSSTAYDELPAFVGTKNAEFTNMYGVPGALSFSPALQSKNILAGDTAPYTIVHYQEKLDGSGYDCITADNDTTKSGKIGEQTDAVSGKKSYTGFTYDHVENVPITSDGKAVAKVYYNRNLYTVNWLYDNGTLYQKSENVKYNTSFAAAKPAADPVKDPTEYYAYTFKQWASAPEYITANADITAEFTPAPRLFTITLNGDSHTTAVYVSNGSVITAGTGYAGYNMAVRLSADVESGYQLDSWTSSDVTVENNAFVMPAKDVTITAVTTNGDVKVTFDAADGNPAPEAQYLTYNTKAVKPADPAKTGYTFAGWYDGANLWNFDTAVTSSKTLTAHWAAVQHTVSFNGNTGSGSMASMTITYGEPEQALTANGFTAPAGYEFGGWAGTAAGAPVYGDKAKISNLTEDLTLYAVWQKKVDQEETVEEVTGTGAETKVNVTDPANLDVNPAEKKVEISANPGTIHLVYDDTPELSADGKSVKGEPKAAYMTFGYTEFGEAEIILSRTSENEYSNDAKSKLKLNLTIKDTSIAAAICDTLDIVTGVNQTKVDAFTSAPGNEYQKVGAMFEADAGSALNAGIEVNEITILVSKSWVDSYGKGADVNKGMKAYHIADDESFAEVDISGVTESGKYYVVEIDGDTFSAYAIFINAPEKAVSPSGEPLSGKGTVIASHSTAEEGETVTLTAVPDEGYEFSGTFIVTTADGTEIPVAVSGNTGTFTMPDEAVSVTASFLPLTYTYTVDVIAGSGIVKPVSGTAKTGETVTIEAETGLGYNFSSWQSAQISVFTPVTSKKATFTMPGKNAVINAVFIEAEITTITVPTADGAGTVTTPANVGDTVTVPSSGPSKAGYTYTGYDVYDPATGTTVYVPAGSELVIPAGAVITVHWVKNGEPAPSYPSKSSGTSSNDGYSILLTNDAHASSTPQPTTVPTALPTPTATGVSPATQTPASPAPFAGVILGLLGAAVVFGLNRSRRM